MPIQILMPALSPTMEKGNLAKWLVKEGDEVKSGDVIAEIETDKATMEYEAVDEGRVGKILVEEGTSDVAVNQPIAVLLEEGEDDSAVDEVKAEPARKAEPEAKQPKKEPEKAETKPAKANGAEAAAPKPAERKAEKSEAGERIFASPLARRLAKENGIDLSAVAGSGPRGRVVMRDVEEAKSSGAGRAEGGKTAPAAQPTQSDEQIKALFEASTYEEVPHDNMRRTIARRLGTVKATIPHFYLTVDCEIDRLLDLRKQINESAPSEGPNAFKVSVNDFVIKAVGMGLQRIPAVNATWTESAMLRHAHSDLAVAVALEGGLYTPVIRKVEQKTISAISREMRELAERARSKKLKPEEYQGGVTAISNLGMYGIRQFDAVINPPQSSIFAVGATEQRVIVKNGEMTVASMMTLTISCDHRVMDGALGAEFLGAVKGFIDNPMGMLV